LHKSFHAHIFECGLLGDNKRNLGKLSGEKQAIRKAKGVFWRPNIDVNEKRECLDIAILVHRVVCHIHVTLADGLPFDTAKMDCFLLQVVFNNLDDREPVDGKEMNVCPFPHCMSSGRRFPCPLLQNLGQ
jgi:hypothetical protein